jgi:hypothetical protein
MISYVHPPQQVPYVKFVKDGKHYDVNGQPVDNGSSPEAHIPLSKYDKNKMPKFYFMKDLIIENIYNKIKELSDRELQKKLWLNEHNDTGLISSYIELMNGLFDDYDFNGFVNKTAREYGLSDTTILELNELRIMLNNYQEKETDKEIINDPKWEKIVIQAKNVLKLWNR